MIPAVEKDLEVLWTALLVGLTSSTTGTKERVETKHKKCVIQKGNFIFVTS